MHRKNHNPSSVTNRCAAVALALFAVYFGVAQGSEPIGVEPYEQVSSLPGYSCMAVAKALPDHECVTLPEHAKIQQDCDEISKERGIICSTTFVEECKTATTFYNFQCKGGRKVFQWQGGSPQKMPQLKENGVVDDVAAIEGQTTPDAKALVESKGQGEGCQTHTVSIGAHGHRAEAKNADALCFDPLLTFPLESTDWGGHYKWIGGTKTCTVAVCKKSKEAQSGILSKLVSYLVNKVWNGVNGDQSGVKLTNLSVYVGNIQCGPMTKWSICQLNMDGRGRDPLTAVMDPTNSAKKYPASCASKKECTGLISFEVRYLGLGSDSWKAAGWSKQHGVPSSLNLPDGMLDWLKAFDEVKNNALSVCQAQCASC